MKRILFTILALGSLAYGKDKSGTYQLGTFITSEVASDGTTTNNIRCGSGWSTVCSGGVEGNTVTVYRIQVDGGAWDLETYRQATDATIRGVMHDEPSHFKAEKENPLDLLKSGDKVLFRVERHRKLDTDRPRFVTQTEIYIPFADNPAKEAHFVAWFKSAEVPATPSRPSDNVRAMCDAHKLSPELERQLCTQPALPAPTTDAGIQQTLTNSEAAKGSPVVAVPLANAGHPLSQQEAGDLVQRGQASLCAVITVPPGAEVDVDGNKAGVSPLVFVLRKQGDTSRRVTIKMTGYRTVEKAVVPDGKTVSIGLALEKQ